MTELNENQAVNDFAQEPAAATPPQQVTMMQFLQMKNKMIEQLNANYKAFMESLRTFPIMNGALQLAMQNFETGLVWMEKGISLVPFESLNPVPVEASQPQASEVAAESKPADVQPNAEASAEVPLDAA